MYSFTAPIQVEIWSDIQCPFCYLGKRQFEEALREFTGKERVEVTWRSYQLDPGLKPRKGETIFAYLARKKGFSEADSQRMHAQITRTAAQAGLDYRFDKMVVANSHAGHRLIQAAKARGLGSQAEEALFQAYFTQGKDLGDREVLVALGCLLGLTGEEAAEAFDDPSGKWGKKVDDEAAEAQALGASGVPFFVFQRQYSVTGAQGTEAFGRILDKVGRETVK